MLPLSVAWQDVDARDKPGRDEKGVRTFADHDG